MPKRRCQECPICIEKMTPTRTVVCPFCEYTTCRSCTEHYIFSTLDDAACMHPDCKRRWDREVLTQLFSAAWVAQKYKKHRENVLFDQQRSLLAATIPYVELERQKRVAQQELDALRAQQARLRAQLEQLNLRTFRLYRVIARTEPDEPDDTDADSHERRSFLQRCPRAECSGWLNTAYRCTVCEHYACPRCLVPIGLVRGVAHECDEDDVKSVTAIKADTTQCPACGVRVHRINGCDAMWCTACRTSFSYRTGRRIGGQVHNPHYFEYMRAAGRQQPRDPGDIPCGAAPSIDELRRANAGAFLFAALRLVRHIDAVELLRFNRGQDRDIEQRTLRVRFMINDIDETEFKRCIQRKEKGEAKNRDVTLVLEMLMHTVTDELRQFCVRTKTGQAAEQHVAALVAYANRALNAVSRRYSQVTPRVRLADLSVRMAPFEPQACMGDYGADGGSADAAR